MKDALKAQEKEDMGMGTKSARNPHWITAFVRVGKPESSSMEYIVRTGRFEGTYGLEPVVDGKPWPSPPQPPEPGEKVRDRSADDLRKFDRLVLHLSDDRRYRGYEEEILRGLAEAFTAALAKLSEIGAAAGGYQVAARLWVMITDDAELFQKVKAGKGRAQDLVAVCTSDYWIQFDKCDRSRWKVLG